MTQDSETEDGKEQQDQPRNLRKSERDGIKALALFAVGYMAAMVGLESKLNRTEMKGRREILSEVKSYATEDHATNTLRIVGNEEENLRIREKQTPNADVPLTLAAVAGLALIHGATGKYQDAINAEKEREASAKESTQQKI